MNAEQEKRLIEAVENIPGYLDQIAEQLDGIRKALSERND